VEARTAPAALTEDIGFLLSRASGLVVRSINAVLASYGLRVRSYSVLALACDAVEGTSQRDLAEVLALDPSQVVLLVDELAASGLVERRPSASDRRTKLVCGTDTGRSLRVEAAEVVRAAVLSRLDGFTSTERFLLRDLLSRLAFGEAGTRPT
jgi:DNA-binding MarR family transcriptional regulator